MISQCVFLGLKGFIFIQKRGLILQCINVDALFIENGRLILSDIKLLELLVNLCLFIDVVDLIDRREISLRGFILKQFKVWLTLRLGVYDIIELIDQLLLLDYVSNVFMYKFKHPVQLYWILIYLINLF